MAAAFGMRSGMSARNCWSATSSPWTRSSSKRRPARGSRCCSSEFFAGVAALLAAVGLYGVLSTVVRQRTAEIGVRMALGAPPSRVFGLVVGFGLRLTITGIAIGFLAALELTSVLKSMLIGVKPTDPATFAVMAALFFLIAALASWLPARRAAALDPVEALREE